MSALTRPCTCENGRIYWNADPYATNRACLDCHGTGTAPICCGLCGEFGAEVTMDGAAYHAACADDLRMGGVMEAERLDVLSEERV